MAGTKLTRAAFEAVTSTIYADNTNEDIIEADFRTDANNTSASAAFLADTNTYTGQQRFNKGADVVSTAALPLIADGNYFDVTGVVTITSFADLGGAGAVITLQFDGILTLTHHATDLILPAGGNITTAAGDHATFVNYASGDYRCINYQRADGTAIASSAGAGDALVANGLNQFAATTSAQLAGVISDETGAGALVFAESPTLVTPALGTPASGVMTNATGTAAGLTSGITNGLKSTTTTVNVSSATAPTTGQVLTATGTTAATWQAPATSGDALTTDKLDQFAATTSAELRGVISDETGTGALVFGSSPTLVTPALGTPASGVATNITGLPVTGLANGTDGELITWSAAGVAETIAVGTATQVLTSNGAGAAPTFQAGGAGDVTKVGTPVDNQVGVWTGDGTLEGDADFTWNGTALALLNLYSKTVAIKNDAGTNKAVLDWVDADDALDVYSPGDIRLRTDDLTEWRNIAGTVLAALDHSTGTWDFQGNALSNFTGAGDVTAASTVYETVWIDAAAMVPRSTNGAQAGSRELATNDVMVDYMAFDTTTSEGCQFKLSLPDQLVDNAPIRFRFYWTAESGSGTVIWNVGAFKLSDSGALDAAFPTPDAATADTLLTANDVHISDGAAVMTLTGIADNDIIMVEIERDVADTLGVDAQLLGVKIQYPVNNTATSVWS